MTMKKNFILLMIITIGLILSGCQSNTADEYLQANLPMPDYIEISQKYEQVSYEKGSEKYNEIYENILKNWWKISETGQNFVDDTELVGVEDLKDLKTTSNLRYATENQILLSFIYENTTFVWTRTKNQSEDCGEMMFVLPQYPLENKNAKSQFIVYKKDQPSVHDGIYTYYFSDELFASLSQESNLVSTTYYKEPKSIDIACFSDISFEEFKNELIKWNNWTHLKSHQMLWNPKTEQLIINHLFSKNATNKELESAKDYWETMEIMRGLSSLYLDIANTYNNIPENAEVIIQVYLDNQLMSQNIYGDIEGNIIYKTEYYTTD